MISHYSETERALQKESIERMQKMGLSAKGKKTDAQDVPLPKNKTTPTNTTAPEKDKSKSWNWKWKWGKSKDKEKEKEKEKEKQAENKKTNVSPKKGICCEHALKECHHSLR